MVIVNVDSSHGSLVPRPGLLGPYSSLYLVLTRLAWCFTDTTLQCKNYYGFLLVILHVASQVEKVKQIHFFLLVWST